MTPAQLGRVARKLPDSARLAVQHWPDERPWIGAMMSGPAGYAAYDEQGRKRFLSARTADAMVRAGVAERRLLWLELTNLGAVVRGWLRGAP